MSPAELPKGSVPGAFFRKVGKPEFAKATPAARYLSWLLLGVGDTSEQALAACGPRFGARDPYAGRSPPGARAIRARIAHRRTLRLPGWLFGAFRRYSAGRGQAAAAPLFAPHKGRVARPSPYIIPTSVWRGRIGCTPVRSVVKSSGCLLPWSQGLFGADAGDAAVLDKQDGKTHAGKLQSGMLVR